MPSVPVQASRILSRPAEARLSPFYGFWEELVGLRMPAHKHWLRQIVWPLPGASEIHEHRSDY